MGSVIDKLEDILCDENGFFMKVRFLEGCDEEKLNEVLLALNEVKIFYANTEMIPKRFGLLVSSLEGILWSLIDIYPDSKKDEIIAAIFKLSSGIQDCFS